MTLKDQKNSPVICIVDDDSSICRALTRLIRSHGFDAVSYSSGEDFLRAEKARESDCLVLDVHLFGMSGFELQEQLTAAAVTIPIVFITAQDEAGSRERAMKGGAIAFLRKPFDDELLLEAIQKAIQDRSLKQ